MTEPVAEHLSPHGRRRRRIADQGQNHQQVSRQRLPRAVELRPCPRPAREGRLGAAGGGFPDHLRAARREAPAHQGDRRRPARCPPPLSRDRPRPRGRGDLLAPAGRAQGPGRCQRHRRQARGVPRDHQARRARGDAEPARSGCGPDRRLPGAPRARLPGGLHALAGALAQAAGLALGRPRAVGGAAPDLRARKRDRGVSAARVLEPRDPVHDAARCHLHRAPDPARRQEARQVRPRQRGGREARRGRGRGARFFGRQPREAPGAAPPGAAVRDLDPAAGSGAQARLRRRSHHAHRAAPVRGRQPRRRDGRPDHLHAHRQRPDVRRGAGRLPAAHREHVRRSLPARDAARLSDQDQERPGGARGDPPDRFRAHAGCRGALARRRPAPPLRADLEARGGEPDGECRARSGDRRPRLGGRHAWDFARPARRSPSMAS